MTDPEAHPLRGRWGRKYYAALGQVPPTLESQAGIPTAICDLTLGERELHRAMRKSYRSLVNWGRRRLVTSCGVKWLDTYRQFHAKVSGRVTRPIESWRIMGEAISAGRGELRMGFLDGELVSGTMTIDGTEIAYYASGVYDRSRFPLPLAHWPLYGAILAAMDRGMKVYELGMVPPRDHFPVLLRAAQYEKEADIGFFKAGFATDIVDGPVTGLDAEGSVMVTVRAPSADAPGSTPAALHQSPQDQKCWGDSGGRYLKLPEFVAAHEMEFRNDGGSSGEEKHQRA